VAFLQPSPAEADAAARAAGGGTAVADADSAVIAFDEVSKAFVLPRGNGQQELLALDRVSFTIRRNEFTTVVGPSGCGKSTLLRLVAGLTPPSGGRTIYKGHDVTALNTDVGVVTQDSNLFPWLTMLENVEFPLVLRGMAAGERHERTREWINLVGLTGFEHHYPYQLSGGMQKRAAIIRTMIYEPDTILMDEPFGPLDAQTRMLLQHDLLNIWQRDKKTILFITHDLVEAIALSDTVVLMTKRPGQVKDVVRVTLPRPRDVFEIHATPGFDEAYHYLWDHFKMELRERTTAEL
jgi:NitT/TauT family transport system ATP-binding protein